jgi:anti-sigma B factor antagonist
LVLAKLLFVNLLYFRYGTFLDYSIGGFDSNSVIMSNSAASLMVALFDHVVCIKVSGKANFTSSIDLKKVVTELAQRGCKHFVLDLSECVLMDSTFLGTLAGIGLKYGNGNSEGNAAAVELLNPNSRIAELLENLGVAHLFTISKNEKVSCDQFQPVASEDSTRADVTRNCLEAHKILMGVNPENIQKFKDVTQFLAEDLKRLEAAEVATKS